MYPKETANTRNVYLHCSNKTKRRLFHMETRVLFTHEVWLRSSWNDFIASISV